MWVYKLVYDCEFKSLLSIIWIAVCQMRLKIFVFVISDLYTFALFFPLLFCQCIPADALESLRQSSEFVCPNDGFLEQVVYVVLGCPLILNFMS